MIAGVVVVGLAIGIWLLWPRATSSDTATTKDLEATATTSSSTQPTAPPPVTPEPSTTTTTSDSHVVETAEEAEAILRELWFGWFEGIYNQDEDRIREVVATEEYLEAAKAAMLTLEFSQSPMAMGILFETMEILRSDDSCLAVWSVSNVEFLDEGPDRVGVDVLRWVDGSWKLTSSWANRDDLWETDCGALVRPSF